MTGTSAEAGSAASPRAGTALRTRTWSAPAYCHAPVDQPVDLGRLAEPGDGPDRWSDPGVPTIYLASDAGVALAELARHHDPSEAAERRVLRCRLRPLQLVDLTDEPTRRALGVEGGATAFLDRDVARRTAATIRASGGAAGLVVPSMAFLDQRDRPNLVLFPEHLPGGIEGSLAGWEELGRLEVGAAA